MCNMKLIICLDDKNGMCFNRRRQSSDAAVAEMIPELIGTNKLWMNSYSGYLFANSLVNMQVCDDFLERANAGDYCFVENQQVASCLDRFSEAYVFRWNRRYPSDLRFPDVLHDGKILREFPGNSHEKITLEVYKL